MLVIFLYLSTKLKLPTRFFRARERASWRPRDERQRRQKCVVYLQTAINLRKIYTYIFVFLVDLLYFCLVESIFLISLFDTTVNKLNKIIEKKEFDSGQVKNVKSRFARSNTNNLQRF